MQSGIYDARGKLIATTIGKIEEPQVPISSTLTETPGGVITNIIGNVQTLGNYGGNIIIRDSVGNIAVFIGIP